MKILLVAPLFRPSQAVSVKRIGYFYDRLSENYEIDVLTFGKNDDFFTSPKTIKRDYFYPFFKARFLPSNIMDMLVKTLKQYDLVIVSVPDFGLLEIVHICDRLDVASIVDLRDQPDLDYYEYHANSRLKKILYYFYNKWLIRYVYNQMKRASYITVVGASSTSIVKKRLKTTNIYNVHNGFFKEDREFVKTLVAKDNEDSLVIGWVGNVYRFRDTKMLRDILSRLDDLAEKHALKIVHFGTCHEGLQKFIDTNLHHIDYQQKQEYDRGLFLKQLSICDMFLLACSDKLIWEPTTSVFDYILFDKPVIFSGLKYNEAYRILSNSHLDIVSIDDLDRDILERKSGICSKGDRDDVYMYSRDKSYTMMKKVVLKVKKELGGSS